MLKRTYRARKLTAAEAARDDAIRRKLYAEFPPLQRVVANADPKKKGRKRAVRVK
jgi:hypothetical protein